MTRRNPKIAREAANKDALAQLVETQYAALLGIAQDDDDATKLDRAAKVIQASTPEVTALLLLGLLGTLDELQERLEVQDGLLQKIAAGARAEAGL